MKSTEGAAATVSAGSCAVTLLLGPVHGAPGPVHTLNPETHKGPRSPSSRVRTDPMIQVWNKQCHQEANSVWCSHLRGG